ncbi:MAG TPA: outer membrane beta-barrel protein [Candidatus Krumholzibacteria bacterium]|nr:outer membrane beta-barrel protein [Candidatus Krumholzibacteria bacterium]
MNTRVIVPTLLLILLPAAAAAQTAPVEHAFTEPTERPGSARPGPYVTLGLGGFGFDLDDEVADRFADLDIDLGETANGGSLAVGWSWSNEFALELRAGGGEVETANPDVESIFGQLALAARAPLAPRARVAPYLEAALGFSVLGFTGDGIEDRALSGGHTGLGGGVEIHLHRRWAVDFGYQFSLIDFEQETLSTTSGDREIELDGSGRAHRFEVRTVFSF